MVQVALINPPGKYPSEFPSLSTASLVGSLKKENIEPMVIDFSIWLWDEIRYSSGFATQYCKSLLGKQRNFMNRQFFKSILNKSYKAKNNPMCALEVYMACTDFQKYWSTKPANLGLFWQNVADIDAQVLHKIFVKTCKEQLNELLKHDFVCISVTYRQQMGFATEIIQYLISRNFTGKIVMGGRLVSIMIKDDPRQIHADYVIIDEAEECLPMLIKGQTKIPNLYYSDEGHYSFTQYDIVKNLNTLPVPDFDYVKQYKSKPVVIPYEISRSCYWGKCAFCQHFRTQLPYREKNPEKIVEDISILQKKYGVNYFRLVAEAYHPDSLIKLSRLISKRNLNIRWHLWTRLENTMDSDYISVLHDAGCDQLSFGLEFGTEELNKKMKKGLKVSNIEKIMKACYKAGIKNEVFAIIGTPSESPLKTLRTLWFLYKNKRYINRVGLNKFILYKSKISLNPETYGIKKILDLKSGRFESMKYDKYNRYLVEPLARIFMHILNNHKQIMKDYTL